MNLSSETSLGTFITMMEQFISELKATFPNEHKIGVYANSFNLMKKSNPRKILDVFMETTEPYSQQIINKDESIMYDESIPLNKELNMKHIWESSGITQSTKDAIWSHLNTLLMFGTTIKNIPSGLMSSIEKLAHEYANQMDDTSTSPAMDPTMLLAGMQNMMKNLK